ncbi:hypothetical protein K469DRAFT_609120 [Zopfia rhizophila CBS 207.26]|uniref:Secreted protein n=1 Tax=Zopfia rhizophila CBS 207.26 TaxID=1314779 RepID=A0A6A6D8V8_9PEZI|nr:hypothetical protein K469DRAFT_609120 [Zopfia rhizophila CBS 207.26]
MKFFLTLVIFAIKCRSRSVRPHGSPGGVYICTQPNWNGDCTWRPPSDDCYLSGLLDLAPGSIGPDPGGYCHLYDESTCKGAVKQTLKFPGMSRWVPIFGSMKCRQFFSD